MRIKECDELESKDFRVGIKHQHERKRTLDQVSDSDGFSGIIYTRPEDKGGCSADVWIT